MKVFIAISALLALASADQSSHQTIQHGHAAPVHTSIHKPHGAHHASVVSQPAADPSDVHNPYHADHKPIAAVHAPAHVPKWQKEIKNSLLGGAMFDYLSDDKESTF
ncbi:unnamed protein product [Lepeophtheirus salmonis]|uniref:(salmon louse) hypothetical protein n=1 Tax=Lepeophtheirus salmonis TaxID=72036 RepID=A0A7R8H4L2_LEPSM|nr:unnamed protein product [Lepeophtheirus salmonis]CAB4060201.1 unnamed protein product [Lepeophtheirus salmonis]CAF2861324.1 unnamed protein product [Lepeophtheirus salmonis]CAF2861338.1 unnamed protein product [Lepeophtheirus salmonis]